MLTLALHILHGSAWRLFSNGPWYLMRLDDLSSKHKAKRSHTRRCPIVCQLATPVDKIIGFFLQSSSFVVRLMRIGEKSIHDHMSQVSDIDPSQDRSIVVDLFPKILLTSLEPFWKTVLWGIVFTSLCQRLLPPRPRTSTYVIHTMARISLELIVRWQEVVWLSVVNP